MSKDKFVFEWRVGDQIRCRNYGVVATIPDLDNTDFRSNWKPYGKTKKRYKAEKLKWQQSRLKEGDWVKRIKAHRLPAYGDDYNGQPFQLGTRLGACFVGVSGYHDLSYLKPCKPPKPKKPVLESENFRIEDGRLVFKKGYDSDWGAIEDNRDDGDCYVPENVNGDPEKGCGYASSEYLREIATLLDRSTAAKK